MCVYVCPRVFVRYSVSWLSKSRSQKRAKAKAKSQSRGETKAKAEAKATHRSKLATVVLDSSDDLVALRPLSIGQSRLLVRAPDIRVWTSDTCVRCKIRLNKECKLTPPTNLLEMPKLPMKAS